MFGIYDNLISDYVPGLQKYDMCMTEQVPGPEGVKIVGRHIASAPKRMSERGYPSILFLYMTEGDLLITRLFYLRVMAIAEYFPNKTQMNYETPLFFKNDSFRGALPLLR